MHAHARPAGRRRLAVAGAALLVLLGAGTLAVARARSPQAPTAQPSTRTAPPGTRGTPGPSGTGPSGTGPSGTGPSGTGPSGTDGGGATDPAPCGEWGCDQQRRLDTAAARARRGPGRLGITVLDRSTGAVWTAGSPTHRTWASSTPKLALATSLLERARAGELVLDATARRQLDAMLHVSDDDAADALWDRFDGAAQLARFRTRYGMTGLDFVPGFPRRWGFLKCSPADLSRLMAYVLTTLHPADRVHVVAAMRGVGDIQHWGVWAAGAGQRPGTKDGWSVERDGGSEHWCTSSVGFAGPGERYVVAVMDDLPPGADIAAGVHAVSDLVATVFGAPVPAPVTVPPASTGH